MRTPHLERAAALRAARERECLALDKRMAADCEWIEACMERIRAEAACDESQGAGVEIERR
jgi:hypothetical protein